MTAPLPTAIPDPRAPRTRVQTGGVNTELWAWLFMRISGVLLIVLILGHLIVNLVVGDGVAGIDFAFVGGKWTSPFWQVWDCLMLWLAMIHGTNGIRTIINDYAERTGTRLVLKSLLLLAFGITVVLGTLVIFTFNPCPPGAPADLLPSVCFS